MNPDDQEKALLELIQNLTKNFGESGESASVGNVTVLKALDNNQQSDLNKDSYWEIRKRLISNGRLETGRGKGGSVRLTSEAPLPQISDFEDSNSNLENITPRPRESDLYEPMKTVIEDFWCKNESIDHHVVEIIGSQGKIQTGGKWTRPDIVLFAKTTYAHLPKWVFEVITFEIKPSDSTDITAVFEALAHKEAATRSYVITHMPEGHTNYSVLDKLVDIAAGFGIGVIRAFDPGDWTTWETLVEAKRSEPDPKKLNDFIATQASDRTHEELRKWYQNC